MTPLTFQTLRLLADGEFRSGEAMAHALGVSRGTIWNALRGLDAAGLELFKVRGRGYRLSQPLRWLDRAAIERELGADAAEFSIEVLDVAGSTNSLLMTAAAAGATSGSVIAAEWQTGGRGRRGRVWHATPGAALTFSLLWRFQLGAGALTGLSLAAGVAVIRALTRLGFSGLGLKWPNDVIWRGHKLAGMLIEMQGELAGPSAAVIGIGINCRLPDGLRDRIDQPVTDLAQIGGVPVDRNRLLATLLRELAQLLAQFEQDGFAAWRDEWQCHHVYQDRAVRLTLPDGGSLDGQARGVDAAGALILETAAGVRRIHSGDVSLRLQHGA
jgi:BirA family biotin operon repressor/biotin-[acetyl-CoA-carboxylase] ligase